MADQVTAQQGDTLDGLLWRERALGPENLAAVLVANRGLADLGPVLPTGTIVFLPVTAAAPATRDLIQLWD